MTAPGDEHALMNLGVDAGGVEALALSPFVPGAQGIARDIDEHTCATIALFTRNRARVGAGGGGVVEDRDQIANAVWSLVREHAAPALGVIGGGDRYLDC